MSQVEQGGRGEGERDLSEAFVKAGTYRSLGEQKLSPQEERFERARRTIGLFLAPAVIMIFLLLPVDMDPTQHRLAAVLLGVIVLWITEAVPIPVGGLIGIVLVVLIGVGNADDVLAPFGSSTVFTSSARSSSPRRCCEHGVARRFAFRMLAVKGVGKSTVRTVIAFGLITAMLSAFVSNTATVAMLLPTAVAILALARQADQGSDGQRQGVRPAASCASASR